MSKSDTTLTVSSGGMRLDQYLGDSAHCRSRSEALSLIKAGRVKLNGTKCLKASASVKAGDRLELSLPSPPPVQDSDAKQVALPVLYEDATCMVIDKPAGIIVHPGHGMKPGDTTILSALTPLFRKRDLPFHPASVLVHRLDKDTTGCLLIAKTPEAHIALQKQFAGREVRKTYLALVAGLPSPAAAVIDSPIGRHKHHRTRMSVMDASSKLREAKTTYRTLSHGKNAALLACDLHTGRTHQLRVHLSTIGHPILGDETYGTDRSKTMAEESGIERICLHAWKFSFTSLKHKRVEVESPLPGNFMKALELSEIRWTLT
ncbi:MAG: RluA family pseudouridine synthase [Candidatus Peribacteraceae bacterium]|nr:RluA family pseudouridine synthase [Candidatus Peribacteraceae bacterium]